MEPDQQTSTRAYRVSARLDAWSLWSLRASLALVAVAGSAYCLSLGADVRYADEGDYLRLADNVHRLGRYTDDGVHATAFRPPGYPLLLGMLEKLGVPDSALRLANVAFLMFVVWASWWLARRMHSAAAAAVVAPLVAVYPIGFYTMSSLYPQTYGGALLLATLVLLVMAVDDERRWASAVLAGLLFGVLIVTIPSFALTMLVVLGVWVAWRRGLWKVALVVAACSALVPGVWFLRNLHAMDSPVLISTNSGINLLVGNSEDTGPRDGVSVDISKYTDEAYARELGEVAEDKFYRQAATDWITGHPVSAAVLFAEKTANYFAPYDELATDGESSTAKQLIAIVSYAPLVLVLVYRLWLWARRRRRPDQVESLLLLVYLTAAPILAVFFTRVRFRAPLDPLLIIVAVCTVATMCWGTDAPDEIS